MDKAEFKKNLKQYKELIRYFDNEHIKKYEAIYKKLLPFHDELIALNRFWHKRLIKKYQNLGNIITKWNQYFPDIEYFNYPTYLNSLDQLSAEREAYLFEVLAFLVKNHIYNKESYQFIMNMTEFQKYNSEIKKQFELYQKQIHIQNRLDQLNYINQAEKDYLLKECQNFTQSLSKSKKCFYNFDWIMQIEDQIAWHNNEYFKKEQNDPIFDNINNHALDIEQRKAILMDEKALLVIAGAGSGKTLTICGKIKYLLEHNHIEPENILCLSYSKKSAQDLESKLKNINRAISVSTFHALGLNISQKAAGLKLNVDQQFEAKIESYFSQYLPKNSEMLYKILNYYGLYLNADITQKDQTALQTQKDVISNLDNNTFASTKQALANLGNQKRKKTLKKEYVKSTEELMLANFYFINGINYAYEQPYKVQLATEDKRQYLPDFYLKDYDIYHEHFGITREGLNPNFNPEEQERYNKTIEWKEQIHTKYNTTCIKTYSYQFNEASIFEDLTNLLKQHNVTFSKLSQQDILDCWNSTYNDIDFKRFIGIVVNFLSLYKGKYDSAAGFELLKNNAKSKRDYFFLDITKDIYLYYRSLLEKDSLIDYDDMIFLAAKQVNQIDSKEYNYKYIIVDEFQDISHSRLTFLQALLNKNDGKLFAVGDDWQSIYSFNGCDIDIFINFMKYFNYANSTFITHTYRNSSQLLKIAKDFISKNPYQIKKNLYSDISLPNPIKLAFSDKNHSKAICLDFILAQINQLNPNGSVLLLGRNNNDLDEYLDVNLEKLKPSYKSEYTELVSNKYSDLKLKYVTVHSSKGLEDDFVIILNADYGIKGFPNQMHNDSVINMVLDKADEFSFSEERRLWYVALTRSKSYTYIISQAAEKSIFVVEIENNCDVIFPEYLKNRAQKRTLATKEQKFYSCKSCKNGQLLKIKSGKFYSCNMCKCLIESNAVENQIFCNRCGDYIIWFKTSDGRSFQGCRNYKKCSRKKSLFKYLTDLSK
ncbi:UvrD-helicase domain-containing protein [Mycoplasma sp. Sp33II]|uniref:UvrD-helicase domain-containing protein n=1 Tax=unclassified Mycoplasma TaxID=2683645 RepID=UPI003AAEAA6D